MDYQKVSQIILDSVGGKQNIEKLNHCATRLRFTLKDYECVDDETIKGITGILGTVKLRDNYQVVVGNEVGRVYDILMGNQEEQEPAKRKKITNIKEFFSHGLDVLSSCMVPLVPAIVAAGMLNVVVTILSKMGGNLTSTTTFLLIKTMANSCFYFLPLLVAVTAAKRFQCSQFLAMVCVGVLLHPDFVALLASGEPVTLFAIPVAQANYSSQIFPSILTVWFLSVIEKLLEKHIPKSIKYFTKPLLAVLITCIVSLVALAPLGYYISEIIAKFIFFVQSKCGWITVMLLSFPLPLLVMTGTHKAISPIAMSLFATQGFDSIFLISFLGFNFSQGAAALAVALKTKNSELKQTGYAAAISGIVAGITEPALYDRLCLCRFIFRNHGVKNIYLCWSVFSQPSCFYW